MPRDPSVPKKAEACEDGLFKALLARLSEKDSASFTPQQLRSLETACQNLAWGRHRVDVRLSIPLIFTRIYMVFLMGKERRSAARRAAEKQRRGLEKIVSYLFIGTLIVAGVYGVFFLQTLIFMLSYSDGPG